MLVRSMAFPYIQAYQSFSGSAVEWREWSCDGVEHEDASPMVLGRESMQSLCEYWGYVPKPEPFDFDPWYDLLAGTCIVFTLVGCVGVQKLLLTKLFGAIRRKQAIARSLSCPALVELKSDNAIIACADMLAAFDSRATDSESPGKRSRALSPLKTAARALSPRSRDGSLSPRREGRAPSLVTLAEAEEESRWSFPRQAKSSRSKDKPSKDSSEPSGGSMIEPTASQFRALFFPAPKCGGPPSPPPEPIPSFGSASADRRHRTHLIVLGAPSVGKSAVIRVLRGFAKSSGRTNLEICEGLPPGVHHDGSSGAGAFPNSCVPLVVWDAMGGKQVSLVEYISRHIKELAHDLCGQGQGDEMPSAAMESRVSRMLAARKLVLCNKTDVQPCPLPEIAALDESTVFLAGSALRGTNMRELWRRVELYAAPPSRSENRAKVRYSRPRSTSLERAARSSYGMDSPPPR